MTHRFVMRACAVAAAGVALSTWAVTAASASGGGSAAIGHGAIGRAGFVAGRLAAATASSRGFAGYATPVARGSATVVETSFTLPTLSCTTADRAITPSTLVPINSRTLSAAFVVTGCSGGTAQYFPGLLANNKEYDFTSTPFSAGDVIDLTTKVSTNRTRVQVTDVTTGVTVKKIKAGARAEEALIGDYVWFNPSTGKLEHVPDFGKLKFRNSFIDGKTLASRRPVRVQRVNSSGTVQIETGSLSTSGIAFATRFEHS